MTSNPRCRNCSDVYLYTVDDLSALVQLGSEKRQAAVAQAEVIIDAGVQSFAHWLDQRGAVPLIQAVRQQADAWREAELARARRMLARGESVEAVLEALSKGLTQKMMHGALAELNSADAAHREATAQAVSRMYLRQASRDPGAPGADGAFGPDSTFDTGSGLRAGSGPGSTES